MIKMTNKNFPAHIHTALGQSEVCKENFLIPVGTKGLVFGHGQKSGRVMPKSHYYFVTEDAVYYIEQFHAEVLGMFRPNINQALERLQNAKNKVKKIHAEQNAGKTKAIDATWDLVGAVCQVERLQRDFNSYLGVR